MKRVEPGRILGIDPGTRHLGTAILEERELIHHGVFDISGTTPRATLASTRRVLARLLEAYEPEVVAIERSFFSRGRNASLLRMVTDEAVLVAREWGSRVELIAPSSVKKAITGNGHASKAKVAESVCQGFPQLRAFLGVNRLWKQRYHANMFDAIAVAGVAYETTRHSEERDHE